MIKEIVLKEGWLKIDMKRASERVDEWNRNTSIIQKNNSAVDTQLELSENTTLNNLDESNAK